MDYFLKVMEQPKLLYTRKYDNPKTTVEKVFAQQRRAQQEEVKAKRVVQPERRVKPIRHRRASRSSSKRIAVTATRQDPIV
ncbi:unnamed protein product, partial [Mesorhabditis spiculigera]